MEFLLQFNIIYWENKLAFSEVEDDDSGGEKKDEATPKKPKVEIYIGNEHIKKLEVRLLKTITSYIYSQEHVKLDNMDFSCF